MKIWYSTEITYLHGLIFGELGEKITELLQSEEDGTLHGLNEKKLSRNFDDFMRHWLNGAFDAY